MPSRVGKAAAACSMSSARTITSERMYAIKLLGGKLLQAPRGKKPGPDPQYTGIEPVVRAIWLAAEQPCGKRLAPALRLWLPHDERHHGRLSSRQRQQLQEVSAATLDRLLGPACAAHPLRGLRGTKPGSLLRTEIPVRTDNWDITRPGLLEVDSVAHRGSSPAADVIRSTAFTYARRWSWPQVQFVNEPFHNPIRVIALPPAAGAS